LKRAGIQEPVMLRNTFVHIEGVGPVTEARLWRQGILSWEELLRRHRSGTSTGVRLARLVPWAEDSARALRKGGIEYFARLLPSSEQWRLYPEFHDSVAYVDIETTGLNQAYNQITVVALYDGKGFHAFVRGKNLEAFPRAVSRYKLIVTFNGSTFDIPFLRSAFRSFTPRAHLDLRWPLRKLGYSGGWKRIEREIGFRRPQHLREIDGYEAVLLWNEYRAGRRDALTRLVDYAEQDVRSLEPLAELVAGRMPRAVGFPGRNR
jgi:uncharacterized protein YprB with RNaseH-like and TPR domain